MSLIFSSVSASATGLSAELPPSPPKEPLNFQFSIADKPSGRRGEYSARGARRDRRRLKAKQSAASLVRTAGGGPKRSRGCFLGKMYLLP